MADELRRYRMPDGAVLEVSAYLSIGEAIAQLKSLQRFQWPDHVRATPNADGTVSLNVITESERRDW